MGGVRANPQIIPKIPAKMVNFIMIALKFLMIAVKCKL
jgi:hypothetical protein